MTEDNMTETLYLIDGHAIAYRAYFALTSGPDTSRWMTPEGEPTAGTYGFASILLRLLENDAFCALSDCFGADRILFGTDSPWADPEKEIRTIRQLSLSKPEIDRILGENAKELLFSAIIRPA